MSGGEDSPLIADEPSIEEEANPPSQSQPTQRRSARLSQPEAGWGSLASADIKASLLAAGFSVDDDLSRDDLISLATSALGNPEADVAETSGHAAGLSARLPGKRKAKAKHVTRPRGRGRPAATPRPAQDPTEPAAAESAFVDALQSLSNAIQGFDHRIKSLESGGLYPGSIMPATVGAIPPPPAPPRPVPSMPLVGLPSAGPSASGPVLTPAFTLASAQPAPPQGRSFIAQAVASVSPTLRANIVNGKDINLASLLLPAAPIDRQLVNCGDVSVILKSSDPRLLKNLSFGEFVVAFGVFRDVLCGTFPDRRAELDNYLAMLADFHLRYGGTLFYEYHKSFSAKAASHVSLFNLRLDWSVVDTELLIRHFSGQRTLACKVCSSHGHSADLCPRTVFSTPQAPGPRPPTQSQPAPDSRKQQPVRPTKDRLGRPILFFNGQAICNNFNEAVCTHSNCVFSHVCSGCRDPHPRSVCPRRFSRSRGDSTKRF